MKIIRIFSMENSIPSEFVGRWCVIFCQNAFLQPPIFFLAVWQFGILTPQPNPPRGTASVTKPGDKCKDSNTARNREARAQPTNSMVRCRDWLRKDLGKGKNPGD